MSLGFLLVALWLGYHLVMLVGQDGGVSRAAIIPFLALCVLACAAWFVLGHVWRRSLDARPAVGSVHPTAGEIYGIPELDAPPARHTGFSGEHRAPSRW